MAKAKKAIIPPPAPRYAGKERVKIAAKIAKMAKKLNDVEIAAALTEAGLPISKAVVQTIRSENHIPSPVGPGRPVK